MWRDVHVQQRRRIHRRRHLVLHRHAVAVRAVDLEIAVHRAEVDLVADGRGQQLAAFERSADHQLAQGEAARRRQRRVHHVLDAADPLALGNRELHRVLARREARPGGVLQRRRHAVHHRQQPHVGRLGVHHSPVAIGDDVADRDDFRPGVIGADVGVNEQLHLVALRALQRERGEANRQRGRQQRRVERRRRGRPRRPGCRTIASRVDQLTPRSDDGAAAGDLDADRMRLAILVAAVRFHAQQVIAGQLGQDPVEDRVARSGDVEEGAARRPGQRLEPLALRLAVAERVDRRARGRDVEQPGIEPQREQARARGRCHRAQLADPRHVVQDEPFADEDQRLGRIDRAKPGEERAELIDRVGGALIGVAGLVARFELDLELAGGHLARTHPAALARDHRLERAGLAAFDRDRLGQRDAVRRPELRRLLADHPGDCLLDPRTLGREDRRRCAQADAGHRNAIRRQQPIDEPVGRPDDRHRAAEADVRLIDGNHDQPAGGRAFVGGEPLRRRRRRDHRLAAERDPFGRHHAAGVAIDLHGEVGRRQIRQRLAPVVHDRHVERGDLDRRLEAGLGRRRLLRR